MAKVEADDGAGTITEYRFGNGSTTSDDGNFRINATTGDIYLTTQGASSNAASNDYETAPNAFTLDVQVLDAAGNWSDTTEITLQVTDVNDHSPLSADSSNSVTEDAVLNGQLPTATDGDGDALTYTAKSEPEHGTLVLRPDGSYTYTPSDNYSGPDSFTYTVSDDRGLSNTYTVTITVEPLPRFTINDVLIDEAAGTATFTVNRTGPLTGTSTVDFITANDIASADTDYISQSGTLTFAANETSKTITISIIDDSINEGQETFTVTLSNVSNAKIDSGEGVGTGTIADDGSIPNGTDDRPLTVSSPQVSESSPYLIYTIDGKARQQVGLELQSGTATVGVDTAGSLEYFDGSTWQTYTDGQLVTIPANETLVVRVALVNNVAYEGAETLKLSAHNTGGDTFTGEATVYDEGTSGNRFDANNITGTPTKSTPDDDRPQPQPPAPTLSTPSSPGSLVISPFSDTSSWRPAPMSDAVDLYGTDRIYDDGLGPLLTSSTGFPVVVHESPSPNLIVFKGITDQYVENVTSNRFSVPFDAFAHSDANASILLSATQADGRKLPSWIQFDPRSGTFQVQAPAGFKGIIQIKLVARDDDGREASTMFRMHVGEAENKPAPEVRGGLTEKLKMAAQRMSTPAHARTSQV